MNDEKHTKMFEELFSLLLPEKMGPAYRRALDENDISLLIRETASYFRQRSPRAYCKNMDRSLCSRETADRAVQGDVTVVNIPWKFPDGKINWHFNPTLSSPPVNHEWLWQLNRMSFWMDLAAAYEETADEKYAAAFNDQVRSWIDTAESWSDNWNSPGSLWRTIETGLRMMYAWCLGFEVFRSSPSFTDENLCLMLWSMYHQCVHLRTNHRKSHNWLLMEMSGLYTFGALFPEFSSSTEMRHHASEKFSEAAMLQILPDGMHDELSPDYHGVLLSCSIAFCNIAALEGITSELPADFLSKLELSFESVLAMATPGLTSPRTNDCFTSSVAKQMKRALNLFPRRQEFIWGASKRAEGSAPQKNPTDSRFLPWAGFAVMRSGWDADAAYCCFDVGPLGNGHMHQDKLNINIYKGADELIYDDGGGQYEHSIYRVYGVSAAAHNTVLVDGLLQRRTSPRISDAPIDAHWISSETCDYACGTYDGEFGPLVLTEADLQLPCCRPAAHTREVRFYKPDFFCVRDRLNSLDGAPHSYEMRLHLDTLRLEKISSSPELYLSDYGATYDILICPLLTENLEIKLLSGVDTPPMAGWFVGRNDKVLHKSTTLSMTVSGREKCTFATLLIPVRRDETLPEIEKRSTNCFVLRWKNKEYTVDLENLSE